MSPGAALAVRRNSLEQAGARAMAAKIPVSVYMITLNEEKNIGSALGCMADFDEVIVVDGGSTDRTVEIAASHANVRLSTQREWRGFAAQKTHAMSLCRNEWVLNVDADETLTREYIEQVRKVVSSDEVDALESTRVLYRWGKRPRCFGGKERLIRLFRKSAGHYPPKLVHESVAIKGKVAYTDAAIEHHENLIFTLRALKASRYAESRARDKFGSSGEVSAIILLGIFPWTFVQHYFLKGHVLDGIGGLLTSTNAAFYAFMKYARLWELQQHRDQ